MSQEIDNTDIESKSIFFQRKIHSRYVQKKKKKHENHTLASFDGERGGCGETTSQDESNETSYADRKKRLLSTVPVSGFPQVGITSKMNSLCVAMFMASPNIVEMLLQSGIDPNNSADAKGIDPFMFACVTGHVENMKRWLGR